jgi:hypothetical protein
LTIAGGIRPRIRTITVLLAILLTVLLPILLLAVLLAILLTILLLAVLLAILLTVLPAVPLGLLLVVALRAVPRLRRGLSILLAIAVGLLTLPVRAVILSHARIEHAGKFLSRGSSGC